LRSVAFDNVTIDRGGTAEQLFLDQSVAAPLAGSEGTVALAAGSPPASETVLTAAAIRAGITVQPSPSTRGGTPRLALVPQGDGSAFRALGLQPGDVLTSINGQSVANVDQAAQLLASPPPDGIATIAVERAGQIIALRASIAR
jgi:general secretion pathway protein C